MITVYAGDAERKVPNGTKSLPFITDKTNVCLLGIAGGVAVVYNSSTQDRLWDGFILDKNSEDVIPSLIKGLKMIQKNRKKFFYPPEPDRKKGEKKIHEVMLPKKKAKKDAKHPSA